MGSSLVEDVKGPEPQVMAQAPPELPQQLIDNGLAAANGGAGNFKKQNEAGGVDGGSADQGITQN